MCEFCGAGPTCCVCRRGCVADVRCVRNGIAACEPLPDGRWVCVCGVLNSATVNYCNGCNSGPAYVAAIHEAA